MSLLQLARLSILKHRYRREDEFCADLQDQVQSGQYALARALERRDKLRAEIVALESPGALIREALA